MNKVSIIVPVYINTPETLKMTINCIDDVLKTCKVKIEIIVVDDGSKFPVEKIFYKLFPQVKVITNEENLGFAKTVNRGIKSASHDLICLINNDVHLHNSNWLKLMVDKEFDITASAFGRLSLPNYEYLPGEAKKNSELSKKEFTYPVFWCALIRKIVFDKIGLLSEEFGAGFFDDVEFSYRAKKAGFKMSITEGTGIVHAYHTTFKSENIDISKQYAKNRKIFLDIIKQENKCEEKEQCQ